MGFQRSWRGALTVATLIGTVAAVAGGGVATAQTQAGFAQWLSGFRGQAVAAGVSPRVVDAAFADVRLNAKVVELDQRQPEFSTPIWKYLERRLGGKFLEDGQVALRRSDGVLTEIEARYGVPKEVVTAVWGIESLYGTNRGTFNVVEALATLAYEGRRRKFGKEQLIEALKILERGDVAPGGMVGSWAGAMGHTQFIPTSYQAYAVDFLGDGKRDIWSDDPTDALASTANYLASFGWRPGEPWGYQVALPAEFDFSRFIERRMSTAEWAAVGVTLSSGGALPTAYEGAALLLPAGAAGPAFLTLNNYRTLLRYNNADAYALAVAMLAERLAGRPPRAMSWPTDDEPLSRDDRKEIQETLTKLGFDTGGVDGIIGSGSKAAIRRFQISNSMIADGYASSRLLEDLRRALAAKSAPLIPVAAGPASEQDVREIQALLVAKGYRIAVDGKSGPRTERAIRNFVDKRGVNLTPKASLEVLAELRRAVRGE